MEGADSRVKNEIEVLVAGGVIEKQLYEAITCEDIYQSEDKLWNFLLFAGYLKVESQRFDIPVIYLTMKIPNEEIRYIYQNTIQEWFERKVEQHDFSQMYQSILEGNEEVFREAICHQLAGSINYFNSEEDFYHGFLLGLLRPLRDYTILSNRENGRPDIVLKPHDPRKSVVILELKHVKRYPQMDEGCEEALKQIAEQKYEKGLLEEGFSKVISYGICFCKKSCLVKKL